MIILNGRKFAANDEEFTSSLFKGQFNSEGHHKTCVGFYRVYPKSVTIMDHQKNKIGVINRYGVLCCATKLDNGKYWYSHATIPVIGEYPNYLKEREELEKITRYLLGKVEI